MTVIPVATQEGGKSGSLISQPMSLSMPRLRSISLGKGVEIFHDIVRIRMDMGYGATLLKSRGSVEPGFSIRSHAGGF